MTLDKFKEAGKKFQNEWNERPLGNDADWSTKLCDLVIPFAETLTVPKPNDPVIAVLRNSLITRNGHDYFRVAHPEDAREWHEFHEDWAALVSFVHATAAGLSKCDYERFAIMEKFLKVIH